MYVSYVLSVYNIANVIYTNGDRKRERERWTEMETLINTYSAVKISIKGKKN